MDELPGGFVETGEDPELAARREFAEETGYTIGSLESLGSAYADAYTNTTRNYYLATDCTATGEQQLEAHEFIELRLISINELIENAQTGRMTDSIAVLLAYEELKALQAAA
jgi:ADP-ribose pyrophosphatase